MSKQWGFVICGQFLELSEAGGEVGKQAKGKQCTQQELMQPPTWQADSSGEEVSKGDSGGGEKVEAKTGSYIGMAVERGNTHTHTHKHNHTHTGYHQVYSSCRAIARKFRNNGV